MIYCSYCKALYFMWIISGSLWQKGASVANPFVFIYCCICIVLFFTLCPTNAFFNCIQNLFLFLFLWIGSGTHLKAFGVAFALATVGDPWPPSVECWKNRLIYLCAWKGRRAGQEKDFLVSSSLCFCCCAYYWLT